jgi:hypothetical protein
MTLLAIPTIDHLGDMKYFEIQFKSSFTKLACGSFQIIITFLDIIGTRRHIASLVNCLELKINSSQRFFGKKFISRTWLKKMLMANFVHLFKFYLHEH